MGKQKTSIVANTLANTVLKFMAHSFSTDKEKQAFLKTVDGWMNFSIGLTTEDGGVKQSIHFEDGKAKVIPSVDNVDTVLTLQDTSVLSQLATLPPNEVLNLMLKNKMSSSGNMAYLEFFNLLISVMMKNKQIKQMDAQKKERAQFGKKIGRGSEVPASRPRKQFIKADSVDKGVKILTEDPYLSTYAIEDFPRLSKLLKLHHTQTPEVCIERAALLTDFFRENGFENMNSADAGTASVPWKPEVRQGKAFRYLMENRKPLIHEDSLLAGTTTTKEIGVPLYPDGVGLIFWGELLTVQSRMLNPYAPLSEEEIKKINNDIFPFWVHRNFREYVRDKYNEPVCQQLDERWAAIFMWKNVALSHTIIDYPMLLKKGIRGIMEDIREEQRNVELDGAGLNSEEEGPVVSAQEKIEYLDSMLDCLEGVIAYAHNLSEYVATLAEEEKDPKRKKELQTITEAVAHCPEYPARNMDEAVNGIWVHWVCIHMENTNAGFSLGRMDQWLQPYFEADMEALTTKEEKDAYLYHVLELLGCFYLNCQDHLPLVPDIGNYLFGGSSSDQAITLGGITPDGEDAVNDMTYVFLKVTEMLSMRDPNINARYNKEKNSLTYLKRLCEVNVNTVSTPSIHNDTVVMVSLVDHNYEPEDLNDWSATGCVEPTISGKHLGHTNCMMFNMVAALEMAMFNGYHPLMRWNLGPKTGEPESFDTFDQFFDAFCIQLKTLADLACEYNNMLGEAHSVIRPTPLMSAMIDGCVKKGIDCTKGGAKYNSSGTACIGLADIVDSLMAINTLVFKDKVYTMRQLFDAVKNNFEGNEVMRSRILTEVPKFGSGNTEAVALANRVTKFMKECFWEHINFRGGHYTTGFWSMSNHVAFGTLAGALPSGRLAGLPFTPGLTPEANASTNLLDNIRDVSCLDPHNMNNNIAFNVKVNPSPKDSHEDTVEHLCSYAGAYASMGGMQMQFNVISSDTMRAAMANPDDYRDLMVRISGYNAYFVELNKELQLELIRRADYGL